MCELFVYLNDISVDQILSHRIRILPICRSYGDKVKVVFLDCQYILFQSSYIKWGQQNISFIIQYKFEKKTRKGNKFYSRQKISYGVLKDKINQYEILSRYWRRRLINYKFGQEMF